MQQCPDGDTEQQQSRRCSQDDIERRLEEMHGYKPQPGQLEVVNAIVEGNKDVILIAKTGYGKSMVFHSIPALVKNTVAVILMPLNALQDDQIDSIRKLKIDSNTHMNPCVLNGETKTPACHGRCLDSTSTM